MTQKMLFILLVLAGCSSSKVKKEPAMEEVDNKKTIKLDYVVKDASVKQRPTWVEDGERWAKEYREDAGTHRYFSYTTESKADKELACQIAKAQARADIASQISTVIKKNISIANDSVTLAQKEPKLQSYLEETFTEDIQANLHGVSVEKTYWEKREYSQKKGATKDFIGYSCSALLKMQRESLQKAVDAAAQKIVEKTSPEGKAHMQQNLSQVTL